MKKLDLIGKILAVCVLLTWLLVLNAYGYTGDTVWNPAANPTATGNWNEAASWTTGVVPGSTIVAHFNVAGAIPAVVTDTETPGHVVIGDGGPGSVVVTNGGSLTTINGDWFACGYSGTASLDVYNGGSVTVGPTTPDILFVGFQSPSVGTFTMHGGTVNAEVMLVGFNGGQGFVHLNGGTLNLTAYQANAIAVGSTVDVAGGTWIINGNQTNIIDTYYGEGLITAYGGTGTLNASFNPGLNQTVITATSGGSTPPPRQSISSITYSGGQVTITYNTTVGASYHIASTSSLAPASWSAVSGSQTNDVTGTSVSYTFTPGSAPQFYETSSP